MSLAQTTAIGRNTIPITKPQLLIGLLVLIPLAISGPQLLLGSIVNSLLIILSTTSPRKNWLILSAIPSLMAIIHGAIFGFFTPYLFYLWPIITMGNWVYMNYGQRGPLLAIITKTLILYIGATVLFELKIIPQILVGSMGIIQLLTASIGAVAAKIYESRSKPFSAA